MPTTCFLTTYKFKNLFPFIDLTHNSILKLSGSSDFRVKKTKKQITYVIIMKYFKILTKSLFEYTHNNIRAANIHIERPCPFLKYISLL